MYRAGDNSSGLIPATLLAVLMAGSIAAAIMTRYGKSFAQWMASVGGRNWSTITATITIVSVIQQPEQLAKGDVLSFRATLTYFYRNPDLQTGDYYRVFDKEKDCEAWAESFKGRTILVHVDPRDPARSILRADEL